MRISSSLWRTRLSRQAAGKIAGGEIHKREIEWSSRTSAELNSCRGRFHVRKDVQGTILESSRTENPVTHCGLGQSLVPADEAPPGRCSHQITGAASCRLSAARKECLSNKRRQVARTRRHVHRFESSLARSRTYFGTSSVQFRRRVSIRFCP